MDRSQQGWLVVFVVAAATFFYFGGEMLASHTDWAEFKTPAGVGEIFGLFASVLGVAAAALKIDLPNLINMLKTGKGLSN